MVRSTRPCRRASSNGVFLHFDFSSVGSSTHGTSPSITITSAGAPLRNDVLKCRLAPLDFRAYGSVSFTSAQQDRLRAVFPNGVCDYSRPGVGTRPVAGVWQTY